MDSLLKSRCAVLCRAPCRVGDPIKNLRACINISVYAGISPVVVPLAADPFFFAGGLHPLRLGPVSFSAGPHRYPIGPGFARALGVSLL